jgi:hypothetical protein
MLLLLPSYAPPESRDKEPANPHSLLWGGKPAFLFFIYDSGAITVAIFVPDSKETATWTNLVSFYISYISDR